MSTAKEEAMALLDRLPHDCSLEDVQYHLYVVEKIHRGIERGEKKGCLVRTRQNGRLIDGRRSRVVA